MVVPLCELTCSAFISRTVKTRKGVRYKVSKAKKNREDTEKRAERKNRLVITAISSLPLIIEAISKLVATIGELNK